MKSMEQLDPQSIWFGLPGFEVEVTVPVPMPSGLVLLTVSGNFCSMKVAVTDLAAFILTVQVAPETASQPVQPLKLDPVAGVAVSVTAVPTS